MGYEIPNSCLVLYMGLIEESVQAGEKYLIKILLIAAKKAITKNWLKNITPDYKQWRTIMDNIQDMEQVTFKLKIKEELFNKRWEKWLMYRFRRGELLI